MLRILLLGLIGMISCTQESIKTDKVAEAFLIRNKNLVLEGMAYDPVEEHFYFGVFSEQKVLKVSTDGSFSDFIAKQQDGVSAVTGLSFDKARQLWFCGSDLESKSPTIFKYKLDGTLSKKYQDESARAKMFNDLTILPDGTVYVTDSFQPAVYKLPKNSEILESITTSNLVKDANGITSTPDGKYVFVSTSNGFARIDAHTDSVTHVSFEAYRIAGNDGLYYYNNSLIGIQNVYYPPVVARYFLDEAKTKIMRAESLVVDHPLFNIPTTGVVVDDDFYFTANSQLLNYDFQNDNIVNPETMREISILKLSLSKPK